MQQYNISLLTSERKIDEEEEVYCIDRSALEHYNEYNTYEVAKWQTMYDKLYIQNILISQFFISDIHV